MGLEMIIEILKKASSRGYIGEPVSQLEHALQAAYFASQDSPQDKPLIAAALLHDIGHLVCDETTQYMDEWGVLNHESLGADFLRKIGFRQEVCDLVRSHVLAKRYLVSKFESYRLKLSEASLQTLKFQGGIMSFQEIENFEANPLCKSMIKIRYFDDAAKKTDFEVPPLESYLTLLNALMI